MDKVQIIDLLKSQKVELEKQFNILKIGLFGSYCSGKNNNDSDVDLIFELEEGKYLGLKEMHELEQFFQNLFQIEQIDLVNQKYINPIIASDIENKVIYV